MNFIDFERANLFWTLKYSWEFYSVFYEKIFSRKIANIHDYKYNSRMYFYSDKHLSWISSGSKIFTFLSEFIINYRKFKLKSIIQCQQSNRRVMQVLLSWLYVQVWWIYILQYISVKEKQNSKSWKV